VGFAGNRRAETDGGRSVSGSVAARGDLFSKGLIRSYVNNARFVERPWLADVVEKNLADRGCRFLLLTGEPGSGKTALMAWLARREEGWPRYFIRRDSRVPLNSGDARSLLFALGHQFAFLRPTVFHPDKLEVVVRQRVGEIAPGGRAVAIRVEDLAVSPFSETALRVEQEAGLVGGGLVGIEAGRLVAEERLLELSNLQHLALLDPAALLLAEAPDARLVILVDALDELRYHPAGESALDWLASCPELPVNVRFILTSRPDERLLERLRASQREWLREARIDSDPDQVAADLARYSKSFVAGPRVAEALNDEGIDQEQFAAGAVSHADGNFQYLAALFRAIDTVLALLAEGDQEQTGGPREELRGLLLLEQLPAGLPELYGFFLSLVRDAVAAERVEVLGTAFGEVERLPAWEGLYQPVLGVLAVTSEPLTPGQIGRFGGVKTEERWLQAALARLGQFLDGDDGRYRLYHASLAEYMTAAETKTLRRADYLDPGEWHSRVAAYAVAAYGKDWAACEDVYVLAHTPTHLVAALWASEDSRREQLVDALDALLSDIGFLEAKVATLGVEPVLSDLSGARTLLAQQSLVRDMRRAVNQEAHHLRRWRPKDEPAVFAQQIYNRAVTLRLPEVKRVAAARLDALALPALRLRWRSEQGSSSLLSVLPSSGAGVFALTAQDWIVSASVGSKLQVWDIDKGAELASLTGHKDEINAIAVMSDGRAISASADSTLRVWDLASGAELALLAGHTAAVNDVAVAYGRLVVSASDDRTVRVWDLDAGNELVVLTGHGDVVRTVATTADGRALSMSGDWTRDWTVRVWDIEHGSQLAVLTGHTGSLRAVAATQNGRVISCSNDGTLRVWDVETQRTIAILEGHTSWVSAFALTADGRVVSASHDRTLRVWDLETARELAVMAGHEGIVEAVAITGDGRAVSGSADRTLRVWDIETGTQLAVLAGHEDRIRAIAITGDARAVSASSDGTLRIWELDNRSSPAVGHRESVTAITFTGDGRIVSGANDWTLRVWDGATGRQLRVLDPVIGDPLSVAATPRWAIFRCGDVLDERGDFGVWDLEADEPVAFEGHSDSVNDFAVTADGQIVSASQDGTLRVWDVQTARELLVLAGHESGVRAVALTGDGRAVSASEDGTLRVWHLATGRELALLAGHEDGVSVVAVTGGGRAVSGSDDGTLRIWDIATGTELAVLSRVAGTITTLLCTRDGRLVSLSENGTIRSWDVDKVSALAAFGEHDTTVSIAVTDLGHVIAANRDRTLQAWDISTGRLIATLYPDAPIVATAADGRNVTVGDALGGMASLAFVAPAPAD
jgi:WD40 repeat protein